LKPILNLRDLHNHERSLSDKIGEYILYFVVASIGPEFVKQTAAMPPPVPTLSDDYGEHIDFESLKKDDRHFGQLIATTKDGRLDWHNAEHVMCVKIGD
jgi:hypothetical protein